MTPLREQGRERCQVLERRRALRDIHEFDDESIDVGLGEERHPRQRVRQHFPDRTGTEPTHQTTQQARREIDNSSFGIELFDSHQRQVTSITPTQTQRAYPIQPAGSNRRLV